MVKVLGVILKEILVVKTTEILGGKSANESIHAF